MQCRDAGFDDFFKHPLSLKELEEQVIQKIYLRKLYLKSEDLSRNSQAGHEGFFRSSPESPHKNTQKLREKFKQQSHSRISIKELIQKDVTPILEMEEDEGEVTGQKGISDSLELHE